MILSTAKPCLCVGEQAASASHRHSSVTRTRKDSWVSPRLCIFARRQMLADRCSYHYLRHTDADPFLEKAGSVSASLWRKQHGLQELRGVWMVGWQGESGMEHQPKQPSCHVSCVSSREGYCTLVGVRRIIYSPLRESIVIEMLLMLLLLLQRRGFPTTLTLL